MYWSADGARDKVAVQSVRTAQANLAMALAATSNWADAERYLELAIGTPGDSPPRWQLLTELGHIASYREEPMRALEQFLQALLDSPIECSEEPARCVLEQLDGERGPWLAQRADGDLYQQLLARGSAPGNDPASKVAARLATLRGDLHKAGEIAQENRGPMDGDSAWRTAIQASTVLSMLEEFRFADALEALDEVHGEDESAVAYLRALALYGEQRDHDAIKACSGFSSKPDLCVVNAISYLALAAATVGSERVALLERARDAAALAARLDSGNPVPNLVRAQVLLEGDLDLTEGRRLLKRAVKHLGEGSHTQDPLLWRLQSRRRDDDLYAYFDVEFAHALRRDDQVIARMQSMDLTVTSHRQDGAARQRLGSAFADRGDIQDAVDAYTMAADSFAFAGDVELERACLKLQLDLEFSAPIALRLAERSWQSSTGDSPRETQAHEATIRGGLDALQQLAARLDGADDGTFADNDLALANVLWGLLVYRRHQLHRISGEPISVDRWRACTSELMAPELVPHDAYYAGHVAELLDDCSLHHASYHFALRAHDLLPDDQWLQSRLIISRSNLYGTLDEQTMRLLEKFNSTDPVWCNSLKTWLLVHSGNMAELTTYLPDVETNALWVQQARASGIALKDGIEIARPHLEDLVKQAISEREFGVAAKTCLRINPDRFDELLRLAMTYNVITPRRAQVLVDFQSLIRSDGREGRSGLEQWIGVIARPQRLLELINIDIPTLHQVYGHHAGVSHALNALEQLARTRLLDMGRPTLDAEIVSGEAWCQDEGLLSTVQSLLATVDARVIEGDSNTPLRSARDLLVHEPLQRLAASRLLARS